MSKGQRAKGKERNPFPDLLFTAGIPHNQFASYSLRAKSKGLRAKERPQGARVHRCDRRRRRKQMFGWARQLRAKSKELRAKGQERRRKSAGLRAKSKGQRAKSVLILISIMICAGVTRAQETGGDLLGGAGIFRPKNPESKRSTTRPVARPTRPNPAEVEARFEDALSDG